MASTPCSRNSAARASSRSTDRATSANFAPASANRLAVASPMPADAPVMRADFVFDLH